MVSILMVCEYGFWAGILKRRELSLIYIIGIDTKMSEKSLHWVNHCNGGVKCEFKAE